MLNDDFAAVNTAIKLLYEENLGLIDKDFLRQSLSALDPKEPICVKEQDTLEQALDQLRTHKVGCVLVINDTEKLTGIFSERDFVVNVAKDFERLRHDPIAKFMTRDPVTQPMDCTIAFALNLMSHGGFRHIPIVDGEGRPVGAISVKDVIDFLVESFTRDLLNFETSA
jgi:CBS domain-containing protein